MRRRSATTSSSTPPGCVEQIVHAADTHASPRNQSRTALAERTLIRGIGAAEVGAGPVARTQLCGEQRVGAHVGEDGRADDESVGEPGIGCLR